MGDTHNTLIKELFNIMIIDKEVLKQKILDGYTIIQCAEYFECSVSTIKRRKKEYGLLGLKTNEKPLKNTELVIIKDLIKQGYILKDISNKVNRCPETLRKYLPKDLHKLVLENTKEYKSNINKIGDLKPILKPSKYSAYITGYLQADGCLSKDGQVSAISKDIELIYLCARFFNSNILTVRDGLYYRFNVTDYKLTEKFKEVTGIIPNKTYIPYKIPKWILNNEEFLNYFIVGVFNGDGWATVVKDRHGIVELGIVQHSSQKDYLQFLADYLGWKLYNTKDSVYSITTKRLESVKAFSEFYLINEFSLSRKKLKILACKDIV